MSEFQNKTQKPMNHMVFPSCPNWCLTLVTQLCLLSQNRDGTVFVFNVHPLLRQDVIDLLEPTCKFQDFINPNLDILNMVNIDNEFIFFKKNLITVYLLYTT